jgi:hypothetical protein
VTPTSCVMTMSRWLSLTPGGADLASTAFIDDFGVAAASERVGNRSQAAAWRVTGLTSPLCEDSRQ